MKMSIYEHKKLLATKMNVAMKIIHKIQQVVSKNVFENIQKSLVARLVYNSSNISLQSNITLE
jgi:hypothetical protein